MKKTLLFSWIFLSFAIFLYSFTQIDLGLTFSRASVWQVVEKNFQYIGYFNRPLSTLLFVSLVCISSILYLLTLKLARDKKIDRKNIWKIIFFVSVILFFSYNAFSYDLFNYIFDAKIVTYYHQNPYIQKALDFPADPMLSFMHWTHRLYPYGPLWLGLTVPLSFVGLGFFLPTFYLFKLLCLAAYLGTLFLLEKTLEKTGSPNTNLSLVFLGLNPLILVESLVSAHNDIVMMFFASLSIYLLFNGKTVFSIISLLASIAIKFATGFLIPIYLLYYYFKLKNQKINSSLFFFLSALLMIIPVIVATARTTYQPWYFLYFLVLAAYIPNKYYIFIPSVIFSIFSLLNYAPFLYLGNWDLPVPLALERLNITGIALSAFLIFSTFLLAKYKAKYVK